MKDQGYSDRMRGMSTVKKPKFDKTSYSRPADAVTQHISLDWRVDFTAKRISGTAKLKLKVINPESKVLFLDSRNLTIKSVHAGWGDNEADGQTVDYTLGSDTETFGQYIRINLPDKAHGGTIQMDERFWVIVAYDTGKGDDCTAAQWLPPSQTAGKKHPYFFTQCQAIHARALLPCQDTPLVKATYDATITCPLELVAVMSACERKVLETSSQNCTQNVTIFRQTTRMPSYLIALAVGDLQGKSIGPRSTVWSEPSMIEQGIFEFAETEDFLATAEKLFGDRSLANVVAHEIAHSWFGNWVTNATWEHFWMNEGFTVFAERKIADRMNVGKDGMFELKALIGLEALQNAVKHFGNDHMFTQLFIPGDDTDPDDSFSSIPYEKGFTFLCYLQWIVGGPEIFEPFIRQHVIRYADSHVWFEEWKTFFIEYFSSLGVNSERLELIDWNEWVYSTGMPPIPINAPNNDANVVSLKGTLYAAGVPMQEEAFDLARKVATNTFSNNKCIERYSNFITEQKLLFLEELKRQLEIINDATSMTIARNMDKILHLTESQNAEIQFRWYKLAISAGSGLTEVFPSVISFLSSVGRMKFVRPLYRQLFNCTAGKELAVSSFMKNKTTYHSICQKMVSRDLNITTAKNTTISNTSVNAVVGIIMGSDSDLPCMKAAAFALEVFKIPYELDIVSAHRTPNKMRLYAESARNRGIKVIIAGAGGAAHLPGMVAAMTSLPVIGVPVKTSTLNGIDSLYSIVQMPRGVPVATVAIGNAKNAGILAAKILGINDMSLASQIDNFMTEQNNEVQDKSKKLQEIGWKKYLVDYEASKKPQKNVSVSI